MTNAERLADLRELMLSAPEAGVTRVLTLILGLTLVGVILWLVRSRRLREEYTPIWMGAAVGLAIVSVRSDVLYLVTRLIGAWTPSSTVFFLGQIFLTAISLNYAVRLSRAGTQLKNLAQEIALLKARLDPLNGMQRSGEPEPLH